MKIIKLEYDLYFEEYYYIDKINFNKIINFKPICKNLIKSYNLEEDPIFIFRYNIYKNPIGSYLTVCYFNNKQDIFESKGLIQEEKFYQGSRFEVYNYDYNLLRDCDLIKLDENYKPIKIYREALNFVLS